MPILSFVIAGLLAPLFGQTRAATPAAPCVTATERCTEWVALGGGPARSLIYTTRSLDKRDDNVRRALIMVHGTNRNADHYFSTAVSAAFLAGALDDAVVISPRVASAAGSCKDALAPNEVSWSCTGDSWRSGGNAASHPELTSFDFVDAILKKLANKAQFPNLRAIVVAGHSAGGQFVARYQMANRIHDTLGVPVTYVVANPSSYAWPDATRPLPTADAAPDAAKGAWETEKAHTNFAYGAFDPAACPNYDRWPAGLTHRTSGYTMKMDDAELKKQLVSRPTTFLLGQVDTLPLGGFDSSCPAMAQGATRRARGEAYVKYINEQLGARHAIQIVPECGHNDRCVYTTDAVLPLVFPKGTSARLAELLRDRRIVGRRGRSQRRVVDADHRALGHGAAAGRLSHSFHRTAPSARAAGASYFYMRETRYARLVAAMTTLLLFSIAVNAQRGGGNNPIASLKGVAIPQRPDLSRYVADQRSLVILGKALFWDAQVGSDGRTACATCHFHAGADHRVTNQIAGPASSTAAVRPNTTLTPADFPFHTFANPNDNKSAATRNRRDVVGSAGLAGRTFVDVSDGSAVEAGADVNPGLFTLGGLKVRQVTSRNAPTVINAVFNLRNFWDGRASNVFNAATPFGQADARAGVLAAAGETLAPEQVRLDGSSLASQSVGPPLNALEMSFEGRSWAYVGRKLLALTPLGQQSVAADDSVLGALANPGGTGLRPEASYAALIRASFQPAYWSSAAVVDAAGRVIAKSGQPSRSGEFSQMAYNFGLFFGVAVQAYESTLISDDTPVDRFLAGDAAALSDVQQQGLNQFRSGDAQCTQCHQGPELSAAGITTASRGNALDPRALGFFRTGVSALEDDPGAAGLDAFGAPLFPAAPGGRASGAFKSPGLRNVELTGPYFHSGDAATLDEVLEFYARNGDVPAGGNLGPGIGNIRLTQQERAQIVDFLRALTDDRVRYERAPFDHPSLCVPVGYSENPPGVLTRDTASGASAADLLALVPAVGGGGNAVPLQTFSELLSGIGRDGSRAHTLQTACAR